MADWRLAGGWLAAGLQLAAGWLPAGWRLAGGWLTVCSWSAGGWLQAVWQFLFFFTLSEVSKGFYISIKFYK